MYGKQCGAGTHHDPIYLEYLEKLMMNINTFLAREA